MFWYCSSVEISCLYLRSWIFFPSSKHCTWFLVVLFKNKKQALWPACLKVLILFFMGKEKSIWDTMAVLWDHFWCLELNRCLIICLHAKQVISLALASSLAPNAYFFYLVSNGWDVTCQYKHWNGCLEMTNYNKSVK